MQMPLVRVCRRMPILNGDLATKELRERGLTAPIVGVTGDALAEDLTSFVASGVNEVRLRPLGVPARGPALTHASLRNQVLTKPVFRAQLQTLLQRYLPAFQDRGAAFIGARSSPNAHAVADLRGDR